MATPSPQQIGLHSQFGEYLQTHTPQPFAALRDSLPG